MRAEPLTRALLAASILLASTEAQAFCRTTTDPRAERDAATGCSTEGLPLYWQRQCVTYRLHEAASSQIALPELDLMVRQAFAVWTNPGTLCLPSISAVALAPSSDAEVGYDENGPNENLIVLRDENWSSDPAALAITTISMEMDSGRILDADLEVNTQTHPLSAAELRYVLAHEVGHFLGLDHTNERGALMQPSVTFDTVVTPLLSEDDAAGICAIYPESGERVTLDASGAERRVPATPCPPFAVDSGAADCGPGSVEHGCGIAAVGAGTGLAFGGSFALAGLVLWARKRRRR